MRRDVHVRVQALETLEDAPIIMHIPLQRGRFRRERVLRVPTSYARRTANVGKGGVEALQVLNEIQYISTSCPHVAAGRDAWMAIQGKCARG